ncbi:MAG TPA: hypothetical protein VLG37_04150 [Candidatus Saccharimonadales bacterium]|nr:hypothetical protein [Candidatus Saccharimonadales bacterium]
MKRFISALISAFSFTAIALAPLSASAAADWQLKLSPLENPSNTSSLNVQYTVLSVNVHDFAVSLYQDGNAVPLATQHTEVAGDSNTNYGNSGTFPVTLADGHHTFHVVAVRDSDNDTETADASVDVDTQAPAAPSYGGKTQSGNTYKLSFTAPSKSDVTQVQIFASTSKSYQAGDSTRVGTVSVSPNEAKSFSYTAPDSATRYFALQAFDAAGNGSATVGDPGTVVTPVRVVNQGGRGGGTVAAAPTTTAGNPTGGQVQGATTQDTTNGQINATGTSKTNQNKGSVLGAETVKKSSWNGWLAGGGGALVVLAFLYYWLFSRKGKGIFKHGS